MKTNNKKDRKILKRKLYLIKIYGLRNRGKDEMWMLGYFRNGFYAF